MSVEVELNLVTRGRGVYLVKRNKVALTRHSMLWLFPDQPHALVDTSEDFEVVSFIIEEMKKTKTGFYSTSQIIELLLNHPEVSGRNRLIERRWKKFQDND